uniref:Small ribosomal subunit protein uS3m n=1 Tax=Amanita muscaria TaxID=41956 RepID=A0A5Q0N324_AMAMU|nr:ribosomal protein S3 [Amanita muscaria]QFZ98619.1 ribosomal protein S3 [Amanita muscaria]
MPAYKFKSKNLDSNQSLWDNQSLKSNINLQNLSIDSRILPLFRTPLLRKKSEEIQLASNKFNLNIQNLQNNLNKNFTNQILKIFLKGITIYNLNLKNYLLQSNKLNLILNIKNDKLYNLNTRISNFINRANKLLFDLKVNSISPNINNYKTNISDTLFAIPVTKDLSFSPNLKEKNINKEYDFRNLLIIQKISTEKIEMKIENNKELIEFGKEIIFDLEYQISQNKQLINKVKKNNKILEFVRNTSLISLDNNSNLNEQLNPTNQSISSVRTEEINNKNKILLLNRIFNSINKTNEIKIEHTINSIINNKEFDYKTDTISINSNPIPVLYTNNTALLGEGNNISKIPNINKYLQGMSKYNMINKGISIDYSNFIGFNFNKENNKFIPNIYNLLANSFKSMYSLISKPVLIFNNNKIIIQLFYYLFIPNILKSKKIYKFGNKRRKNLRIYLTWKKRRNRIKKLYRNFRKININTRIKLRKLSIYNITQIFPNKFKFLCEILSNLFKKNVELELIRLHYPYNDSNILANLLAIMINKIKLRIIVKRIFGKAVLKNKKLSSTKTNKLEIIPAFLSGINIKVGGRLLNNKMVPRKTVKIIRRGAVAKGKINYLDVARFTNKNKRGAYSITVSSGQKFF